MEEALRQQTINRLQKKQQLAYDESTGDSPGTQSERNTGSTSSGLMATSQPAEAAAVPDIELVFKPYPGQSGSGNAADTRYIKTTMNATVEHMSKYLAVRIALDQQSSSSQSSVITAPQPTDKYKIYIAPQLSPGETAVLLPKLLPCDLTLADVGTQYWKSNRPLELLYELDRPAP